MEQNNNDVIEIDLREIFMVLLHWWWVMLLSAIIIGASAFAVSKFVITPTYESTTRIVILSKQNESTSLTYSDVQLGTQLTKDYAELIKSRYVIEQVLETFRLDTDYEDFIEKVDVVTPTDTRIIDITMTDPDPLLAKEMVDEIRTVAAVRIKEVMDIEAVNVVDEGNLPENPANPSIPKWTVIGALLGAFAAAAVILIRFLLDDTIKTSEDVEKYLNLSTLALIPISVTEEEEAGKKKRRHRRHSEDEEDFDEEQDEDGESESETQNDESNDEEVEIEDLSEMD